MRPIRLLKLVHLLSVLLVLSGIYIDAESKEKKSSTPGKNWSLAVKGGITLNAGNTESRIINGGLEFNLKSKEIEYLSKLEVFYGSSKQQDIVNKGKWFNKIAGKRKKRFNLYGTASVEYDEFARIALRGSGGLGLQYTISDAPHTNAKLAASINGEYTDARDKVKSTGSARLNLNYSLKKKFSKTGKYSITILYTSNLASFFGDYRVEASASLSVLLKNPLSLKIEMQERYTNHPLLENLKKNDFILVTSLEISI